MDAIVVTILSDFSTLIRIGVFTAFFLAAGLSIYRHRDLRTRQFFVVLFLLFLVVPGITSFTVWPFFPWHLYEQTSSTNATFHELRVADDRGNELRYDARAAEPIVGSVTRRIATAMAGESWTSYSEKERRKLGCYLIREAQRYRSEVGDQSIKIPPRHQLDYKWEPDDLAGVGEFTELRVYRVEMDIAEDGSEVLNQTDTRVVTISLRQCS